MPQTQSAFRTFAAHEKLVGIPIHASGLTNGRYTYLLGLGM